MSKRSTVHDPFNPEPGGMRCPACQGPRMKCPEGDTMRVCPRCGRTERWVQPARKHLGDRRYERLLARQRKKFGDLEMVLFQWVADPESRQDPPEE